MNTLPLAFPYSWSPWRPLLRPALRSAQEHSRLRTFARLIGYADLCSNNGFIITIKRRGFGTDAELCYSSGVCASRSAGVCT
jgi:hypothetical protein